MSKYPTPEYSRKEVNRAGDVIVNPQSSDESIESALLVVNNWRASHNFPLNTFQMRLRNVARKIHPDNLVAQRIKRLSSIKLKLERFSDMKLAQMQDIGGCRAIMRDVAQVDTLVDIYRHESRGMKHKIAKEQDYIFFPKTSGYRGIHLIYKYHSDKKGKHYEDMRIEIQVRTLIQHAWATAVETVGTFIKQSLKSSQGEADWLRFFALMSSAMAIEEGKPIVSGTPSDVNELRSEIIALSAKLDVDEHLTAYRDTIEVLSSGNTTNAHYYLLELDPYEGRVIIKSYSQTQLATASSDYLTLEKRIINDRRDAVLVSADSVEALKLAFPNYYLDTDLFLAHLRKLVNNTNQLTLF
jgi:hypothetical protein